jgi:hypothetical protein
MTQPLTDQQFAEIRAELATARQRAELAEVTVERMKRTNRMVNGGAREARERAERAEAELAASTGCPDPVECDHEAEVGQLRAELEQTRQQQTEVERLRAAVAAARALAPSPHAPGYTDAASEMYDEGARAVIRALDDALAPAARPSA